MVETDWRRILSFSQKELNEEDKEKLCDSLSWMEADDIELNFSDLKTLFRLAQDILKFKSEQVNSLLGQLETSHRKNGKKKSRVPYEESPTKSSDSVLETIAHQEELIKANKDILEQLYADIAELEGRKNKLEQEHSTDKDSESSRDVLSEMNAFEQLEKENAMKNKHIRKLLADVKVLEEDNIQLKEKTSVLKDKLNEATKIIESLTVQLFSINSETSQLKEMLGKFEETKAQMSYEIKTLQKELANKESEKENIYEEVRSKVQHWKNLAKAKKVEYEILAQEHSKLKEDLSNFESPLTPPKPKEDSHIIINDLQEKLTEATKEINDSAKLIEVLRSQNKSLKASLTEHESHETSVSDGRNESDDGKQRALINKLKKKNNLLINSLREAEQITAMREKEIAEITSELQILKSGDEGFTQLMESLKSKKKQLKLKDDGIKSLVQDVNNLNQTVDELQLENEAMRMQLNIPPDTKISTKGILKKHQHITKLAADMKKQLRFMENKVIALEIEIRDNNSQLAKMIKYLHSIGCDSDTIKSICDDTVNNDMPMDGGGEAQAAIIQIRKQEKQEIENEKKAEVEAIMQENEGLRKGLQEILDFLKDNSKSSSGILALQCPSLEAVLHSMEARHAAGWLAPHMAVVMELKAALGGKDALLSALHEARKETFEVMTELSKESRKTQNLEQKLQEIENTIKPKESGETTTKFDIFDNSDLLNWTSGSELTNIDFLNNDQLDNVFKERNSNYESQLRNCLAYFHNKFKELFDKISIIAIKSTDEQNKWYVQEEQYKAEIENLKSQLNQKEDEDRSDDSPGDDKQETKKILLSNVEQSVMQKQIERLCDELESKDNLLKAAENKNLDLMETQTKMMDHNLAAATVDEYNIMKDQLEKLAHENKILKDQYQHVGIQLDSALMQLQDTQQKQITNDMEVNMLRHQILDLQCKGDNKAIIARLSSEILVSHVQSSEIHKKIERLNTAFSKENQKRIEAEEMLKVRENIFNIYSQRYESKFKYLYEIIQILIQQYHGCIAVASVEKYLNDVEDLNRKSKAVDEKLDEIEDMRFNLMNKHTIYDQIINMSRSQCLENENNCEHKLKLIVMQGVNNREIEFYKKKIESLKKSRDDVTYHCNHLEKTLVLVNQGFAKTPLEDIINKKNNVDEADFKLVLEDVESDDESRRSQTVTLPKPQVLKSPKDGVDMTKVRKDENTSILPGSPQKNQMHQDTINTVSVYVQTKEESRKSKIIQTDADIEIKDLRANLNKIKETLDVQNNQLSESNKLLEQKSKEVMRLYQENMTLQSKITSLNECAHNKDQTIESLQKNIELLQSEIQENKNSYILDQKHTKEIANNEHKALLESLQRIEEDKNKIVKEYKIMLQTEREEYLMSLKDMNIKIAELKSQLERKQSESSNAEAVKEVISKYSVQMVTLEDNCFKLQSEVDNYKTEMTRYQSEADRWKELATERLARLELLNSQLQERHCHEVDTYKAENQHWLTQLNETQREHMELRNKLSEQKTMYVKQLSDKDALIDQLRNIVQNLKSQIMNMQTLMSANDPGFDLTAIVELDDSEASQRGDPLEIKYDSSGDVRDDVMGLPSTSTAIWQEPIVERLRREKMLTGKQNNILRRQVKALAARERRARLEAHNLKNQIYRISTSGSKAATAESASLQSKIASLQTQLSSARRDSSSGVALWEKWKKAQQSSERWQARYEEKFREVQKLEGRLRQAAAAVARLEREKQLLLRRLDEAKAGERHFTFEKQELERSEKDRCSRESSPSPRAPHIPTDRLMDRIEAQQRRIAALELADKGNEPLVSEYERSLAEVTALKGQVLKLESALLESQMRTPVPAGPDAHPELEYYKSYCDMLKEENLQLSMRLSALEAGAAPQPSRVADLEQTVLTLRGLVSKLQAEQKTSASPKRLDSRPSSSTGITAEKSRTQLESYRTEIANLKRTIVDKDNLLERSKEMLKIAAEREDKLLRENSYLRRKIEEMSVHKGGFHSA
ncbi:unnamed protein product [Plutella xylostella]|uniref:(diamondback moth) hypothetical protein n=1 Tax=Plutella xylostella TaxID=51655 RepID=A0A8S4G826_PLUXY|nr:unnamed protein product [Plutella xylostella]